MPRIVKLKTLFAVKFIGTTRIRILKISLTHVHHVKSSVKLINQLQYRCVLCSFVRCGSSKQIKKIKIKKKKTNLPKAPWSQIAADFYGPLLTGEKLLVVTDFFSKFTIVEIMKTTSYSIVATKEVSTRLDNLFSLFGYPDEITTDNGPPWDSHDIKEFFTSRGIKHTPSIPYRPRSNGQVERFMPNLSKIIRHSYDSKTDWKDTLR